MLDRPQLRFLLLAAACASLGLAGCSGLEPPPEYVTTKQERDRIKYGTVHGNAEGIVLFDTRKGRSGSGGEAGAGGGPAVNAYLWRAALETIDFMPLASTDPIGGVIITDWYSPPETPDERFKINVYVLDQALRADGVKVSVFRQTRSDAGWSNAAVDPKTPVGIEDSILTRARELRIDTVDASG